MIKKSITFIIAIIIVSIYVSGCFEKEDNNIVLTDEQKFVGTWENITQYQSNNVILTYTFFENKSYMSDINNKLSFWGTWNISNNNIMITIDEKDQIGNYRFLDKDQTLEITDSEGTTIVLTKK